MLVITVQVEKFNGPCVYPMETFPGWVYPVGADAALEELRTLLTEGTAGDTVIVKLEEGTETKLLALPEFEGY